MERIKKWIHPNYLFILVLIYVVVRLYLKTDPTLMKCFYILILAFILGQVHVGYLRSKLFITLKDDRPVAINKQEGVEFTLVIRNTSFLQSPYLHIFLKPSYHAISKEITRLCITLPPYSEKEIRISYEGKYSGKEILEIEKVILQDFFQIARRRLEVSLKKEVAVLPEVVELKHLEYLLKHMRVKSERSEIVPKIVEEGEISSELKPYQEGDSLKRLHWKLVAKRDLYMVRERERGASIKREYIIVLDPVCKEQGLEKRASLVDKTLVSCISYMADILKSGDKVTLLYFKEKTWEQLTITSILNLEEAAKVLATYDILSKSNLTERWPVEYLKEKGEWQISKLFITPSLSPNLAEYLEEEKYVQVLEMKRSHLGEALFGQTWYVSQQFEVMRNV